MSKENYQEAFHELQQIVSDIEEGQISVDDLSDKVKRAAILIKVCKAKLSSTEENVQKILADIEQAEPDEPEQQEDEKDEEVENKLPF